MLAQDIIPYGGILGGQVKARATAGVFNDR
jgi:hypothetical protein